MALTEEEIKQIESVEARLWIRSVYAGLVSVEIVIQRIEDRNTSLANQIIKLQNEYLNGVVTLNELKRVLG